jgi:hypothetical protein
MHGASGYLLSGIKVEKRRIAENSNKTNPPPKEEEEQTKKPKTE